MEFVSFTDFVDWFFLIMLGDEYKRYMWAYFVAGAVFFAVMYSFKAVALYTIARREGYKGKWMAFVPFLSTYYIGVVSDKNRIFRMKAQYVAIVAAVLEFLYVALNILLYTAKYLIFEGGYAVPEYEIMQYGEQIIKIIKSYTLEGLPHSLEWAGWVFYYLPNGFTYWLSVVSTLANIFLLICFFQTYASRQYVWFSLISAIFPVSGIFMFAVRNHEGKNYGQYLRERQQQRYRQYQEYIRQNGGIDGYNNQGGQSGPNPYNGGSGYGSAPQDPFDGMGSQNEGQGGGDSRGGDPFDDF